MATSARVGPRRQQPRGLSEYLSSPLNQGLLFWDCSDCRGPQPHELSNGQVPRVLEGLLKASPSSSSLLPVCLEADSPFPVSCRCHTLSHYQTKATR